MTASVNNGVLNCYISIHLILQTELLIIDKRQLKERTEEDTSVFICCGFLVCKLFHQICTSFAYTTFYVKFGIIILFSRISSLR